MKDTQADPSPAYLTSHLTEPETVLAEYLGLERGQRRLLAVMRQPCTPRLGMRTRLSPGMSDDTESETGAARLVNELRTDPARFRSASGSQA